MLNQFHKFINSLAVAEVNPNVILFKTNFIKLLSLVSQHGHQANAAEKVPLLAEIFTTQRQISMVFNEHVVKSYIQSFAGNRADNPRVHELLATLMVGYENIQKPTMFKLYMTRLHDCVTAIEANVGNKEALSEKEVLDFFEAPLRSTPAAPTTPKANGFFKPAGSEQMSVTELKHYAGPASDNGNIFNESLVDSYHPRIANTVRSYRDSCAAQVKAGKLVSHLIIMITNTQGLINDIKLIDIRNESDKTTQVAITLHYSVYNAIKNNEISSITDIKKQVIKDYAKLIESDKSLELSTDKLLSTMDEISGKFSHLFAHQSQSTFNR
ncbi:hypothetical protein [Legionella sp. 16cNR16C]|uniref:hypothetical protein n=1 Tax=Legionella sp. 16cNR16C TaxID=2905656 RepID=UPI001E336A2C|nr:hypothetical protein [Legionella sp. 16cNR16C]MCE3043468.1 hypothetical protein [Legionella sp. 16cNR16C]